MKYFINNTSKCILLVVAILICFAGKINSRELNCSEMINIFKGSDVNEQRAAFDALRDGDASRVKKVYKTPEMKKVLYKLLTRTAKSTDTFIIGQGDLAVDIMAVMGDFKDTRAMPYLLANVKMGGAIIDSLALLGEPAVNPMLNILHTGDISERIRSCEFFQIILSTKSPTIISAGKTILNPNRGMYTPYGDVREKIRASLKDTLNDKAGAVLDCSITALRLIDNPADKEIIEQADSINPNKVTPESIEKDKERGRRIEEILSKKRAERRAKGLPEEESIEGN